ncbi:MAG: NAD(P)H-dependent oxidoreductase [bacterium]|nr:NAD(P)H-dependent oxidoreductase [bacterium]
MRLTIFNGSPCGKGSNSKILTEQFLRGFTEAGDNDYEIHYITHKNRSPERLEAFDNADIVLLVFPLYIDSLPAIVKKFIEELELFCGRENNPKIVYFVHSGFPEAYQSRFVQRYLEKLARRLGCEYIGTIVKGGSEGIQAQPEQMTRKLFDKIYRIGKDFGETGTLEADLLKKLAKPEKYSALSIALFGWISMLMSKFLYWNPQLKKNGAFEKRYDKPYLEE